MRLDIVELDASTTRLVLEGRLDAVGADRIETSFTAAASSAGRHIFVDLQGVAYIGSLGIRMLIASARVVQRRGLKMVLIGAQAQPQDVFETVALADLIPIVADEAAARALLAA